MLNLFRKKVANREKAEFADIYTKYYPSVLNMMYSKVGCIDTAENLAHDLFLKYLSQMKSHGKAPVEYALDLAIKNFDKSWSV
ncbi:MAG: hypothetical protein GY754_42620 [bacterium]|nr:hypothetical protein [bacterium]